MTSPTDPRAKRVRLSAFATVVFLASRSAPWGSVAPGKTSTTQRKPFPEAEAEESSTRMYPLRDLANFTKTKFSGRRFEVADCLDFVCDRDEGRCDNYLSTSYEGDTPPCCSHIMRDMAREFDGVMSMLGLEYFVGFGTLLGLVRSDKIIPWTGDNDFMLPRNDHYVAMLSLWDNSAGIDFVTWPWPPRMCITSEFAGGKLRRWTVPVQSNNKFLPERGYPYGDIYEMKNLTDGRIGGEYPNCEHHRGDVYPIERRLVYNNSFAMNFPREPESLVRRYYGLDWRTPQVEKRRHGGTSNQICKVNVSVEESLVLTIESGVESSHRE